jgi:uncharacterized protein YprB with RNaseH-like and TPR domain
MKLPRVFFDLETIANLDALQHAPAPEPAANLKDPEKIAKSIADKRQEQIDRAPLDPDYGEIVTLGYATHTDGDVTVLHGNERDILNGFWSAFSDCAGRCVGYNILSFDLPYLQRRSMALGIKPPFAPNLAKYRTDPITDLMGILYNWGPAKGLKQVSKLYGLPVTCPDVDGSQVGGLSLEKIIEYQASDVKLTISLYERMNGVYFNH